MLRVYGTCSHSPWWIYIYIYLLFTFLFLSFSFFISDLSPLLHSLSTYIYIYVFVLLLFYGLFYKNNTFFHFNRCLSMYFHFFSNGNSVLDRDMCECCWIERFITFFFLLLFRYFCVCSFCHSIFIQTEIQTNMKKGQENEEKRNNKKNTITGIV